MEAARTQPVTARGQETRARLLTAAENIFGQKSYFTVSIADITREAGVGNGTFYLYFPSKEAVFRELVEDRGHEMRAAARMATESSGSRVEAERAGFAAFFDFIARHRSLYRVVRQAEFVDPELYRAFYVAMAKGYTTGLLSAMDAGEIAVMDPEVLAYCLMGIGDFVGMRWVVWPDAPIPEDAFEQTMRFVKKALSNAAATPSEGGGRVLEPVVTTSD